MKKKVKIFLHHDIYQTAKTNRRFNYKEFFNNLGSTFTNLIFEIFYTVGLFLVTIVKIPYSVGKGLSEINLQGKSWAILTAPQTVKSVAIFTLVAFLSAGVFQSFNLLASGGDLKGKILGVTDEGIDHLLEARTQLEQEDFESAQASFENALIKFQDTEKELTQTNSVLKRIIEILPPTQQASGLIQAAQLISQAGSYSTEALVMMNATKFGPQGIITPSTPKEDIQNLLDLITKAKQNLNTASELMNNVNPIIIPEDNQLTFVQARDLLNNINSNTNVLYDIVGVFESLFLGQKNLLLVFQNNNELRPTGGFMGTIGSAKLHDGVIKELDIRTVYDYDGQLKEKILPPQPYLAVTDRLFLRDSNWLVDFPSASKQMGIFFEKEGGETPDLIIAITPQLVVDLLKTTGPVEMEQYGIVLTSENFVEQTQIATSVNYDKELNQPKQMLADFFPVLLQRLGDDSKTNFFSLFQTLANNLSEKHILISSKNSELQAKLDSYNWSGAVKETDKDYLQINSANLSGSKSDLFIERSAVFDTEIGDNGEVTNTLKYTVRNRLPNNSIENLSFVRFLVPLGSKLISAEGFHTPQIPFLDKSEHETMQAVREWEETSLQQNVSGTLIGEESNKTFFGNWIKVAGGQESTVTLRYTLPFQLNATDSHSLLVQKQAGVNKMGFEYNIAFPGRKLVWQNFRIEQPELLGQGKLQIQTDLTRDSFYGLITSKHAR